MLDSGSAGLCLIMYKMDHSVWLFRFDNAYPFERGDRFGNVYLRFALTLYYYTRISLQLARRSTDAEGKTWPK
jgi:hypothetical protein